VGGSGNPSNPGIVGIVWAGDDDSPNLVEPDRMYGL